MCICDNKLTMSEVLNTATQTLWSKDIPKHFFSNNATLSHIMPPHLIMAPLHCYSTFEDKPALFQLLKPQSLCEWPGGKVNSQINFDDTQAKRAPTLSPFNTVRVPPPQKKPCTDPLLPAAWELIESLMQHYCLRDDCSMVVSRLSWRVCLPRIIAQFEQR